MIQWIDVDFYMKQTLTHPKSVSEKNNNTFSIRDHFC